MSTDTVLLLALVISIIVAVSLSFWLYRSFKRTSPKIKQIIEPPLKEPEQLTKTNQKRVTGEPRPESISVQPQQQWSNTMEEAVREAIAKSLGIPQGVSRSDVTITLINDQPPPLPQKYIFNPTYSNRRCIQALIFIAKADGQFREEEAQVMARLLCKLQPEHLESQNCYMIDQIKNLPKIGYAEYKELVSSMNIDQLTEFFRQAQLIVGTQEKVHPFEEVLLDNLKEQIKIAQRNGA